MAWRSQAQGDAVPRSLEDLAQPHIDSFDYFLGEGMEQVIEHMDGIEVSFNCICTFASQRLTCLYLCSLPYGSYRYSHTILYLSQIEHPNTGKIFRFWLENAIVRRPVKEEAASVAADQRLFPRECRETVRIERNFMFHLFEKVPELL